MVMGHVAYFARVQYGGRKVQGGVDEAQHGREEEGGGSTSLDDSRFSPSPKILGKFGDKETIMPNSVLSTLLTLTNLSQSSLVMVLINSWNSSHFFLSTLVAFKAALALAAWCVNFKSMREFCIGVSAAAYSMATCSFQSALLSIFSRLRLSPAPQHYSCLLCLDVLTQLFLSYYPVCKNYCIGQQIFALTLTHLDALIVEVS
jgi:hypothetical protein